MSVVIRLHTINRINVFSVPDAATQRDSTLSRYLRSNNAYTGSAAVESLP